MTSSGPLLLLNRAIRRHSALGSNYAHQVLDTSRDSVASKYKFFDFELETQEMNFPLVIDLNYKCELRGYPFAWRHENMIALRIRHLR